MPTLAVMVFPAEEMVLADTLEPLSECRIRVEENAFGTDDSGLYVWIDHHEANELRDVLAADDSITEYELLKQRDGEWLVELGLTDAFLFPRSVIRKQDGTVLQAFAADGYWKLHTRFPTRSALSTVADAFDRFEITVFYESITESSATAGTEDLTDKQRETLQKAIEMGYYEIPREATIEDLAAEFGVSHQSISERLRRAQQCIAKRQLRSQIPDSPDVEVDMV